MDDETLTEQNFSSEILDCKQFSDCVFKSCCFNEVKLHDVTFRNCKFVQCDFQQTHFDGAILVSPVFEECKLTGADFHLLNDFRGSFFFHQSVLIGCNFSGLGMKKSEFRGSRLMGCLFVETNLEFAFFYSSDLKESLFHESKLDSADFSDAKNYSINILTNTTKRAKFSMPEAMSLLREIDIEISP